MSYYDKVIFVNSEEIENINAKDTATFDKPKICGCFSIDKDRAYVEAPTNMQYYYSRLKEVNEGSVELNLNSGIDRVVRKPENLDEKLDHLLTYILHNKRNFIQEENKLLDSDFVCYRGLLTKIMCAIHLKDQWTVCATKWKGSIYLCEVDKKVIYNIPEAEMNKFSSWGYKFEQYMVSEKLGEPPDTSKPVHESEEFCCIFKSKLGSHKLIYGAEMDAVYSCEEIDKLNPDWDNIEFIELKTSKKVQRSNDERTLHMYKFIKWWAQCFLANVNQVHCGFRDRNGIVRNITPYNVRDLPKMSNNMWDWKTCLNFCNIFLNIVKDVVPDNTDDPYTVWKFEWRPEQHHIKYQELKGRSPYSFLPQWYIDTLPMRR